jgi:hypothetical protein
MCFLAKGSLLHDAVFQCAINWSKLRRIHTKRNPARKQFEELIAAQEVSGVILRGAFVGP